VTLTASAMTGPLAGNDSLSGVEIVGISGTNGGNTVDASTFPGVLSFRGGNGADTIKGGTGSFGFSHPGDTIWSGTGADSVDGNAGGDRIEGNGPHTMVQDLTTNTITGGAGFDTLVGGQGLNSFDGGADPDQVFLNAEGTVTITNTAVTSTAGFNPGTQTLANVEELDVRGGNLDESFDASAFTGTSPTIPFFGVSLHGDDGDDTLVGSHGQDSFDGGAGGNDRLVATRDANFVLTSTSFDGDDLLPGGSTEPVDDIEEASLTGGAGANTLNASSSVIPVTLKGGAGNDTLAGGTQADLLNGEGDFDGYDANGGDDTLVTKDTNSEPTINCGSGIDTVTADIPPGDTLASDCETATSFQVPTLTRGPGTGSFTEEDPPTPGDPGIALSDPDDTATGATVAVTQGFQAGSDVLALPPNGTDYPGITGSYNSGTGVLTLTIPALSTPAQIQAALRAVTFENTSDGPSETTRRLSYRITTTLASNFANRFLDVNGENDPPTLATSAGSSANTAGSSSVVDPGIVMTDPDGDQVFEATIRLTDFQAGDVLEFTDTADITGAYNANTGVLTLNGFDDVSEWQAALRSITFRTTNGAGTRTVEFKVDDFTVGGVSSTPTKQVAISAAPTGPGPGPGTTPTTPTTPTTTTTPAPPTTPPIDVVAGTRPGCFNIPSVARDRTVPLPSGGKLIFSTRQVDDPVNPLRITARVVGARARSIAFKINGRTVAATGSATNVPATTLKVGSRSNKVEATVTLTSGKKATATQLLVVLRCPLPIVTCKRATGKVTCASRTPLGALRVKASLINSAGKTVASGSAPVKQGKYTATLRGTVPAGRYQYRHVATTRRRGERLLMVRVVAIR
jgi:RTX calcium-binding nonapeptide repeat (4 copies)